MVNIRLHSFWSKFGVILLLLTSCASYSATPKESHNLNFTISTIAVIPAFYAKTPPKPKVTDPVKQTQYNTEMAILQTLSNYADKRLAQRIKSRTRIQVISEKTVEKVMEENSITADTLYTQKAKMDGSKFPAPILGNVQKLAALLKVSAIVMPVLDGPQDINGHYVFTFLGGSGYQPPFETSRAAFYVVYSTGHNVCTSVTMADHPVTQIGQRTFQYADWRDMLNLLIENFLDDLTEEQTIMFN